MAGRFRLRDSGGRFQSESEWFKVEASGPVFDGTGIRALKEAERRMSEKVAKAAQRHIQTIGRSNFRYEVKPATHVFENNVEVERVSDGHLVHANNVIYGSWLEGTSERNRTTRFKGYHLFRRAAQDTEARLGDILSEEEIRLVGQLNGTGVRTGPVL
jgi:hypothetical protein